MLRNKTAIECWNILKYEIESIIEQFVPLKKIEENGLQRNTCQQSEAIRKIAYKQTMWRVYMCTRKDEDCANYKEALNATTTEIRQSKRSYTKISM